MKVLAITGGTGFIGRHVVRLAAERGYEVRVLVKPGSEHKTAKILQLKPEIAGLVSVVRGKITDVGSLNPLTRGADVVIHLAGMAHSEVSSDDERARVRAVNVGGAQNVMDSAREHGVRRVVVASSAHVYAGQRGTELKEDAPQAAENIYAESKIQLEKIAHQAAGHGMEIVIGRPCLTYGPNVAFNLHKLMQAIETGIYFHAGSRRVLRSFGSVYSAAAAFLHLAESGAAGEAYNIADREPMLLEDFTNDLAERMKRRRPMRIPYPVLWSAAAGFTLFKKFGVGGPLTLESLRKLTDPFSLSTEKLAASGFEWPDNGERAREDMVRAYFAEKKI
jgi:UDP-glucose 4-epimerase